MTATYFLFGEPGWQQMLFYVLVLLASVGGFVFTVVYICAKVFRGGEHIATINPDAAGGRTDERR
ncbi:MAG TPA: hypothetical protein VF588_03750 [Pyrinomonadaceae bacterium]|jgi:hypothetical protein